MLFNSISRNFALGKEFNFIFKKGEVYRSILLKGNRAKMMYDQSECTVEAVHYERISVSFYGRSQAFYPDGTCSMEKTLWLDSVYYDDIAGVVK